MKIKKYDILFVDQIPETLENKKIYICIPCNLVIHKCACGCGEQVVTPIDIDRGWILTYDGETISLSPSIGNWSFNCQSHYCIHQNHVKWLNNYNHKKYKKNKILNFFKKKRFVY